MEGGGLTRSIKKEYNNIPTYIGSKMQRVSIKREVSKIKIYLKRK
jgi:hypothetical protein